MSPFLALQGAPEPQKPHVKNHASDEDDALLAFQAETTVATSLVPEAPRKASHRSLSIAAAMTAFVAIGGVVAYAQFAHRSRPVTPAPVPVTVTTGIAKVDANPDGAVTIDGVERGMTPLTLSLPIGTHTMEITVGDTKRSLPLTIEAGTTTKQDVEFATDIEGATGRLEITSEPSGADVTIDGSPKGVTPLTVIALPIGVHKLTISGADTTIRRTVNITAGATASVVASITSTGSAAGGWITIKSPIELTVVEGGEVLGTTNASRLMLPAGPHNLELTNAAFEFRTAISVQIAAGKTVKPNVAMPNGSLSINALPWANVIIDGQPVGMTPLGNLSLPVGSHEIVWSHPQLGERRRTVSITARSPVRVAVDFSQ